MTTTTAEKVSAAFIGFFTFLGTLAAVVLILFLLIGATLVDGKTAPWLQPYTSSVVIIAPILGIGVGTFVAWRYLQSQSAKRAKASL